MYVRLRNCNINYISNFPLEFKMCSMFTFVIEMRYSYILYDT